MQKRKNSSKTGQDGSRVFLECVQSIRDVEDRKDMSNMSSIIGAMCWNYLEKAERGALCEVVANNSPASDKYFSHTSKEKYINLYEKQFRKSKAGKKIYDAIKLNSVNCPACGVSEVSTLDHYLPKTKFPQFSVFPANLVPNCSYCNTIKGEWTPRAINEQVIHPYFDDRLTETSWLFAEIIKDKTPFVNFYVQSSYGWTPDDFLRAATHLEVFKLKTRFLKQALLELSNLGKFYSSDSAENIRIDMDREARKEYNNEKNSWKTALYRELARNTWYHEGGYREFWIPDTVDL